MTIDADRDTDMLDEPGTWDRLPVTDRDGVTLPLAGDRVRDGVTLLLPRDGCGDAVPELEPERSTTPAVDDRDSDLDADREPAKSRDLDGVGVGVGVTDGGGGASVGDGDSDGNALPVCDGVGDRVGGPDRVADMDGKT